MRADHSLRAAVGALVTALVVTVGACSSDVSTPPVAGSTPLDSADQFMVGVRTRLHDGGVLRANVEADSAFLFQNSTRVVMFSVRAEFYTSTGVKEGIMTADRARYDLQADSLEAFGNVNVVSLDGRKLVTPYLRYNKALNEIASDSAFTATGPDLAVSGVGFVSDPGVSAIRILRRASGSAGTLNLPGR